VLSPLAYCILKLLGHYSDCDFSELKNFCTQTLSLTSHTELDVRQSSGIQY